MKSYVFILTALLLARASSLHAAAEDPASVSTAQRVEEINALVESRSKELEELLKQQGSLEAQFKEQQASAKKIQGQESVLKAEFQKTKSQVDSLKTELQRTDSEISEMAVQSRARLRVLYMQKDDGMIASVFAVSNQSSLRRNAYYLSKIRARDEKLINNYLVLKKQKQEQVGKLAKILDEQSKIQEKISAQRQQLNESLKKQEGTVKSMRAQKDKLEDAIASMKAQALRLETVLTSLTGKEGAANASQKEKLATVKQGSGGGSSAPFVGPGLESLKGKLSLPVSGAIVSKSSQSSGQSFKEMVTSKGLEFIAKADSGVRVVAAGKVIFSGKMPGLGNIIIIDHGTRSYSLYGRLAAAKVSTGDELKAQDVIASLVAAGESGNTSEKANFYFEIRKNGLPVDTRKYFAAL